jgi:hypothetical protein
MGVTLGEWTLALLFVSLLISRQCRQPTRLRTCQNRIRLQRKSALGTNRPEPDVPGRNSGAEQSVRPRLHRCTQLRAARKGDLQPSTAAQNSIASSDAAWLGSVDKSHCIATATATADFIPKPACASNGYTFKLSSCQFAQQLLRSR